MDRSFFKEIGQIKNNDDLLVYFKVIGDCQIAPRYIAPHIYDYVFTNRKQIIQNYELIEYIKKYPEIHFLTKLYFGIERADIERNELLQCVQNNYINALKVLHNAMYPWDEIACELAAINGYFHCLKLLYNLYKNKCFNINTKFSWGNTLNYAVQSGNLNIVIYAHQHGCPFDIDKLIKLAKKYEYTNILNYLQEYMNT